MLIGRGTLSFSRHYRDIWAKYSTDFLPMRKGHVGLTWFADDRQNSKRAERPACCFDLFLFRLRCCFFRFWLPRGRLAGGCRLQGCSRGEFGNLLCSYLDLFAGAGISSRSGLAGGNRECSKPYQSHFATLFYCLCNGARDHSQRLGRGCLGNLISSATFATMSALVILATSLGYR